MGNCYPDDLIDDVAAYEAANAKYRHQYIPHHHR